MANKIHVKSGDTVIVISGKDKGKSGRVLKVDTKTGRVFIEGVNIVSKHQKAKGQLKPAAIIETEGSIHASNVMFVDSSTGKPTRIGRRVNEDGSKVRIAKKSGAVIDTIKKAAKEG